MKNFIFLSILLSILSCQSEYSQPSNKQTVLGGKWEFSKADKAEWYPAEVPGVVHLDLLANGLIEDPYWENNEKKQQWIENEDWIYKSQFELDHASLKYDHIELNFEGLDTYAKVSLNGQQILDANNMFRQWNIDIKQHLKKGVNELEIEFESPIKHNKKQVESYPQQLPSGNEAAEIETKVSAFSRKAAYHFGWDWGPRFVTAGIWKPISLSCWNNARILNTHTTTLVINGDAAEMQTSVEIEVSQVGEYQIKIGDEKFQHVFSKGIHTLNHFFEINEPKLWWSNGMGSAHLYQQKVELIYKRSLVDSDSSQYGVRTIELVNEADSIGTSFYFKLNGKAVFMKGANYIPQDVFLPRVSPEQYVSLITAVKEANMNMLRVWGGGIYENDLFYDLCDQNGILVWQDFMFAGSLYPNDDAFKENIKEEAIDNIKRLRKHPCIALWCGNNEIEVAWKNWGWQKQYDYSTKDSIEIWNNYISIFQDLLPNLVSEYHPQINYTSTSPLSNWGTTENFNHSSMHYWGVWHGRESFENFEKNVGRFMVEYGFQSFPNRESLEKVIADSNMHLNSPAMQNRQKSYIGNGLISKHIAQYFGNPKDFSEFIQLSQKTQAKGMQMAIRTHFQNQPHCMGSLFWQLNDCWPGPSWSVIDYYGNKKEAYQVVKEEFSTQ